MEEIPLTRNKVALPHKLFTPLVPGKYFCQPFWHGKNQSRQEIQCYFKKCFIQEDIGWRTELVCSYVGYKHLVALTTNYKWEPK